MTLVTPPISDGLLSKFRLTRLRDVAELEGGVYWPQLQPYFVKPYFRRLTYRLTGAGPLRQKPGVVVSTRGASGLGDLDIAYVADRHATAMSITETGLPDYCLTSVLSSALEYRAPTLREPVQVSESAALIYRGLPDTCLSAAGDHERLAIWIPAAALEQRLAALLGHPPEGKLDFAPHVDWESGSGQSVKRLVQLLTAELASPDSFILSDIARQSFTDTLLYALLHSVPHSYTDRLARGTRSPVPRCVHRAEAFIRSRAGQPIALHEVAAAAGCSVRALQLGFRQFRETTPAAVIRQARLEAVRDALAGGEIAGTVTELAHQYGFTNPGRFTGLFKAAFGVSPAETLRGPRPFRAIRR